MASAPHSRLGDIAQSLFRCSAELVKVIEITVERRNGQALCFGNHFEIGYVLWSLDNDELEKYDGVDVDQVEVRMEKIYPFGLHGGLVWVGGDL